MALAVNSSTRQNYRKSEQTGKKKMTSFFFPTKYNVSEIIQNERVVFNIKFCSRKRNYIIENIYFVILLKFREK